MRKPFRGQETKVHNNRCDPSSSSRVSPPTPPPVGRWRRTVAHKVGLAGLLDALVPLLQPQDGYPDELVRHQRRLGHQRRGVRLREDGRGRESGGRGKKPAPVGRVFTGPPRRTIQHQPSTYPTTTLDCVRLGGRKDVLRRLHKTGWGGRGVPSSPVAYPPPV